MLGHKTGAIALPFLLLALLALAGCSDDPEVYRFSGPTMGTSWNATVVSPPPTISESELESGLAASIEEVNALMSNWRDDSEVSRFNRAAPGDAVPVSAATRAVVEASLDIYQRSGGAFDITVGPLIELWGFGTSEKTLDSAPDNDTIAEIQRQVGSDALLIDAEKSTLSKRADRAINLSAIAKGYAVDRAAEWLMSQGVQHFMVEIGGEVRTGGLSPRGDRWRIGIESPELVRGDTVRALALDGKAVATSGDYRNYYNIDGQRMSHTIDPVTGRPITHKLASVSVIHENCMYADGWATALDVLGPDKGMEIAEREGLAVYMLVRNADGEYQALSSTAFAPWLVEAEEKSP